MKTNKGIEISTSLLITLNVDCTNRSSVFSMSLSYESQVNRIPMPISVKAVGKPIMIATTTSDSISRPRCPRVIVSADRQDVQRAGDEYRHQREAEPQFLADLHLGSRSCATSAASAARMSSSFT